ncbi:MAG TPA: PAS domain S-box protein [Acidobacteriota bacterium]
MAVYKSAIWTAKEASNAVHDRPEDTFPEAQGTMEAWIQAAPVGIVAQDRDAKVIFWNPAAERMFGWLKQEVLGRTLPIIPEGKQEEYRSIRARTLRGETITNLEVQRVRKDESLIDISLSTAAVRDTHGGVSATIGVMVDITEGKRLEERLRLQTQALEATASGVVITDPQGTILWVNPAFTSLAGYQPEEAVGKNVSILKSGLHPRDFYLNLWETILAGEVWHGEMFNRRKDGSFYPEEQTITPVRSDRGEITHFIAIKCDVSGRKQAEETLRESEKKYRELVNDVNDGVCVVDSVGRITFANRALATIHGFDSPESLLDRKLFDFLAPSASADIRELFETSMATQEQPDVITAEIVRPDGTHAFVELKPAAIVHEGRTVGARSIVRDITQRVKAEEERRTLESQMVQMQKMEAVGLLAGGIAHDFNNLLTGIIGYSTLLLDQVGPESPIGRDLGEIIELGNRGATLTRQLLAFSRKQTLQPVVLSLNDLVESTLKILGRVIGEDIELHFCPLHDLWNVRADPGQIEQVLMNLAVNARDAMPNGGKLVIEASNTNIGREYADTHEWIEPGSYVMLAISDNGSGMDAQTQRRIFEPFFTTKEVGKGTGLGLSTVYGIVKQHKGHILVCSEVGKGTTFKIYLPRSNGKAIDPATEPEQCVPPSGTETILIAEDQDRVRAIVKGCLEAQGYTVLCASCPAEAQALFLQNRQRIALLLTDFVMPGCSGRELYERLSEIQPALKVLYMSGYPEMAMAQNRTLEPGAPFISKPFTPAVLARKVREILDRTGARPVES